MFAAFFAMFALLMLGFAVVYLTLLFAGASMIWGAVKDEWARYSAETDGGALTEADVLLRPAEPSSTLLRPAKGP